MILLRKYKINVIAQLHEEKKKYENEKKEKMISREKITRLLIEG